MATLSIVVPVFNKAEYLDSCIESILNQTFADFELILINDGSTDGSGKRCDIWQTKDPRVIVLHQENQGVSAARNRGIQAASGQYIGFADGDDLLESDMYELLIRNASQYDADVSVCGVKKIFPHKTELYFGTGTLNVYDKKEALIALLRKEFLRSVYDKIYRTTLIKEIHFEGHINEDIYWNYLVLNASRKTVFDDTIKYNYIIRDNSVSMTGFSKKWMDTISFSQRIVKLCRGKTPEILDEAINFDLVTHISLLNLILLSGRKNYETYYQQVAHQMTCYSGILQIGAVRKKHKYAYQLFRTSPRIYEFFMKAYCRFTDADVSNKS